MAKDIKFSHEYIKMPENLKLANQGTMLLEVFNVAKLSDLSPEFQEYDTSYWQWEPLEEKSVLKHYPLPRGRLLVLLLRTDSNGFDKAFLWTTVRSYNADKEAYYRGLRGKYINIIRKEEEG